MPLRLPLLDLNSTMKSIAYADHVYSFPWFPCFFSTRLNSSCKEKGWTWIILNPQWIWETCQEWKVILKRGGDDDHELSSQDFERKSKRSVKLQILSDHRVRVEKKEREKGLRKWWWWCTHDFHFPLSVHDQPLQGCLFASFCVNKWILLFPPLIDKMNLLLLRDEGEGLVFLQRQKACSKWCLIWRHFLQEKFQRDTHTFSLWLCYKKKIVWCKSWPFDSET